MENGKHDSRGVVASPGGGQSRRQFLAGAGIFAAGNPVNASEEFQTGGPSEIPRRPFGRSGEMISALGVGGHHLGDIESVDEAVNLVHEAVDAGITFFDNCWEYHNGKSEDWLGRGLKGRREKVFLM